MTPEQAAGLDAARVLIAAGAPVFAAPAARNPDGSWDHTGGTGGTGYRLPIGWQHTEPTTDWLDPAAPGFENKAWRPGYALCAVMGAGLDLVDVDPRNGGNLSREQLVAESAWPFPYATSSTPSGGSHSFVASLHAGSRDGLRPGVDVKGGYPDGAGRGFAFLPPTVKASKDPENLGTLVAYRWTREPTEAGLAELADGDDRSGDGLAALLRASRDAAPSSPSSGSAGELDRDPFALDHVGPILAGGRHHAIYRYGCSLRARDLPASEADTLMRARWEDCEQPAGDPYPLEDALAVLRDAYRRHPAGPSAGSSGPAAATLEGGPEAPEGETDEQRIDRLFPVIDWHALWADSDTDPDWLLEPLIEVGQSVALVGPAKCGKSLLVLEAVAALAAGRPVLGNPARRPLSIVYVDFENSRKMLRERLEEMGYAPSELENLHYLPFPNLAALDSRAGGAQLAAVAARYDADLVVIDTTARVIEGDENDADTFRALYRHTMLPLKRIGRAVLRIDHSGKDVERGARGSSAKNDDVDAVWQLAKLTETRLELRRTHDRAGHGVDRVHLERQTDPYLTHVVTTTGAALDSQVVEIVAELNRLGVPLTAGRPAARAALRTAGQRVANTTLIKALAHRKGAAQLSADSSNSHGTQDEPTTVRAPDPVAPDPRSKTVRGQRADSADTAAPISPDDLSASPPLYRGDSGRTADPELTGEPTTSTLPVALRVVPREGGSTPAAHPAELSPWPVAPAEPVDGQLPLPRNPDLDEQTAAEQTAHRNTP